MHAVIRVGPRDDVLTIWLADDLPIAADKFDRRIHRVTAAAGEEHLGACHRCHRGETICEVDGGSGGEVTEV